MAMTKCGPDGLLRSVPTGVPVLERCDPTPTRVKASQDALKARDVDGAADGGPSQFRLNATLANNACLPLSLAAGTWVVRAYDAVRRHVRNPADELRSLVDLLMWHTDAIAARCDEALADAMRHEPQALCNAWVIDRGMRCMYAWWLHCVAGQYQPLMGELWPHAAPLFTEIVPCSIYANGLPTVLQPEGLSAERPVRRADRLDDAAIDLALGERNVAALVQVLVQCARAARTTLIGCFTNCYSFACVVACPSSDGRMALVVYDSHGRLYTDRAYYAVFVTSPVQHASKFVWEILTPGVDHTLPLDPEIPTSHFEEVMTLFTFCRANDQDELGIPSVHEFEAI